MRLKVVIIAGLVVLALGFGGWTVAWFAGRGTVEDRIAAAVADIEARGFAVSHGAAEISGFPTGYVVRVPDVALVYGATGEMLRLADVRARWQGTAPDRITLELPAAFNLTLPNSEEDRQRNPGLPPILTVQGQAQDWEVAIPTEGGPSVMTAARLSAALDQEGFATRGMVAVTALRAELPESPADQVAITTQSASLDMRAAQEPGPVTTLALRLDALGVQLELGATPLREIFFAGAKGGSRLQYAYARAAGQLDVTEDPLRMDGVLAFSSGEGAGAFSVTDGVAEILAEHASATWSLQAPTLPGGAVDIARAEFAYTVPTAPSEIPVPGRMKIALEQVEGAPELWAQLDPGGKLDHSAGNLIIDTAATLRLMARLDELPPGFAPPYEVSNVSLNQGHISALGAAIDATGDVEIVQPAAIPIGSVEIQGAGLTRLIGALGDAGFLSPELQTTADAILQVYARPGAAPDTWESLLRVGVEGVSVNGLPIQ